MNHTPKPAALTHDHFSRFGAIIHTFAKLEYLMQGTIAAVAGIKNFHGIILTKILTYSQKRDTLYSFMIIIDFDKGHQKKIRELFDRAHTYSALRNNIAHALWFEGKRPNSIRAGYLDLRYGRGVVAGFDEDEKITPWMN